MCSPETFTDTNHPLAYQEGMGDLLFDIPEEPKGNTCRTCQYRERHQCGGSIIQYCGVRKSNRTYNGKLKIKCKMAACIHYVEEKKPETPSPRD